jgi:large repetitive protein
VTNASNTTATGVVVSDVIPAGTVFASVSSSQGTVMAPAVGGNGTMRVSLGTLAKSTTATISLIVTVTAASGTVLTDTSTVTAAQDLNTRNNSATVRTTVGKN